MLQSSYFIEFPHTLSSGFVESGSCCFGYKAFKLINVFIYNLIFLRNTFMIEENVFSSQKIWQNILAFAQIWKVNRNQFEVLEKSRNSFWLWLWLWLCHRLALYFLFKMRGIDQIISKTSFNSANILLLLAFIRKKQHDLFMDCCRISKDVTKHM